MPEELPDDDACYIISKHIYLKKKTGLIDAMVKVPYISMGDDFPEYAKMKLPKIKSNIFGKIVGFFKMTFGEYRSESGVILNLKTHPQNPKLKKIDYTIPHQMVSSGRCKYNIVIDPTYINCGTIHCHSDFAAFHSGVDETDERYFDGLHITVGHIDNNEVSISACIVVNSKRVPVDPRDYIEGIELSERTSFMNKVTKFYRILDQSTIVSNRDNLKFVTPFANHKYNSKNDSKETTYNWDDWFKKADQTLNKIDPKKSCEECIFKEVKIDNMLEEIDFDDLDDDDDDDELFLDLQSDDLFDDSMPTFTEEDRDFYEKILRPKFNVGEVDENGVVRRDNFTSTFEFESKRKEKLKKSIKCEDCGSTFFVENPEVMNECPRCEKEHIGQSYTITDFLIDKQSKEGESSKL